MQTIQNWRDNLNVSVSSMKSQHQVLALPKTGTTKLKLESHLNGLEDIMDTNLANAVQCTAFGRYFFGYIFGFEIGYNYSEPY